MHKLFGLRSAKKEKKVNATNKSLVFYDIYSLFTSSLVKETIDIVVNFLFTHNTDLKYTKTELKKLMEFATNVHIFFSNVYFMIK